ncbi:hypothetical protein HCN51_04610 [Nonomuraea sp. FMUSA5-5]|uniref:Uncharacterized protein n=1 Tax=Nonomuraea composti TaxID=2720023 RepID=A0ABX1AVU8_9ACTN|nr:hypothetical protein [Nonomuraea sp. FMUSA5-5]NJP88742.1 hypothetical protein [Nonomuraea sp. FMUSA5-5]
MAMAPRRIHRMERVHQIGSAVVWVGMWTGAALILRGHPGAFGSMIPLLAAGSVVGLALPGHDGMRFYLIGSLVVWVALLAGAALLLGGTPWLGPVLGLLAAGAAYFLVVAPTYMIMWPPRE